MTKAMSLLSDKGQNDVLVIFVAVHLGHIIQFDEDFRLWNTHEKGIWKEWSGLAKDDTEDWNKFMAVSVSTLQFKPKNLARDCIENYIYNSSLSILQSQLTESIV